MSTETKAYTPGAERAARQIGGVPITNGFYEVTRSEILAAEIISRETRDAEMLEGLRDIAFTTDTVTEPLSMLLSIRAKAKAIIAKVEGR